MCVACKSNMRIPHSPSVGTETSFGKVVGSDTFFIHERDLMLMLELPYPHADEGRLIEYGILYMQAQ